MQLRLKWKFSLVLVLVLALMFASSRVITSYINQQSQELEQQRSATMEWVLVFSRDMESGEVLRMADLQQRKYPPSYINDEWLRPEDASAVVGNEMSYFVSAGAPVMIHQLRQPRPVTFADRLAEDEYAVTIAVGIEQLHHGLLRVGNHVALVANAGRALSTAQQLMTLSNIEVLAIDQRSNSEPNTGVATTLTLRLSVNDAVTFEHMRRSGFAIWLQKPGQVYPVIEQAQMVHIYELPGQGASQ